MSLKNIPLSLYIHIPWCKHKCPYCDFNSVNAPNDLPEEQYLNALLNDLSHDIELAQNRPLNSIFIGGGTPTLLKPEIIAALITKITTKLNFTKNIEITVEANPGTLTPEKIKLLTQAGINRLSIGAQSFQNSYLNRLGRIHNAQQAINSIETAKQTGLNNINIDLMFGLPQQTVAEALLDIKTAIKLQPNHISWYQLTLEPNTPFYEQQTRLPNEEIIYQIQQQGQQLLTDNNFKQYEISAYSLPQQQCNHNLNYWQFGDYLGIGAGAHSKITDLATGEIRRYSKISDPNRYLSNNSFIEIQQTITAKQLPLEFMINTLRLQQPTPLKLFTERTGLPITAIQQQLNQAEELQLITRKQDSFVTTVRGKLFLNDLIMIFA